MGDGGEGRNGEGVARTGDPGAPAPDERPAMHLDAEFDELYQREHGPMVRLAFLLLGDDGRAADVVYDAFAVVHERWDRLDNPGAYLRRCVVNRCHDQHRRRRLERRRPEPDPFPTSSAADVEADELADALARLPRKRRAALVLRFYEDLSEADIAEALGVRRGTVKSLISRGLDQLREVIEP